MPPGSVPGLRRGLRRRGVGVGLATALIALVAGAISPATSARASVINTGLGFDTCSAPSLQQMTAWLASPYRSVGIYIGGANAACPPGNLSPAWLNVVESEGWRLVPTYVGLQAPCADQSNLIPIDESQPATEGTQAADNAIAQTQLLGFSTSTPIYLDMEAYNNSPSNNDPNCVPSVLAFEAAWSTELHRLGYVAGLYGSTSSTISDEVSSLPTTPALGMVDDIWFADWNGSATVSPESGVPSGDWGAHQRLHQYAGGHNETYNGVTLNIDSDYDDGALACIGGGASGAPAPRLSGGPASWGSQAAIAPGSGPGAAAGQVSVVSAGPTRVDAFWRGTDKNLWTASFANGCGWGPAWSLGSGPLGSDPQAVSSATGRIDVFWRGADGGLWHDWNVGSGWNGPGSLGGTGTLSSAPSPVSPGPTGLAVVWRRTDGNLGSANYSDATGWQGPFNRGGGPLGSNPHAVTYGAGSVAAFWRGQDNNLWEMFTTGGGWTGPTYLGAGPLGGEPHPTSAGPGRMDVFWRGTDQGVWHVWTGDNRTWQGPATQGATGTVGGQVISASAAPGRIAIMWVGVNGNLWSANYADGVGWSFPAAVGPGPLGTDPSPVSPALGFLDVYWPGSGGAVVHQSATGI